MRENITELIDDIKYHSDTLTDLERLPVIQLKVLLAKMNKLTEKTTILLHYVEKKALERGESVFEDDILPGELKTDEKAEADTPHEITPHETTNHETTNHEATSHSSVKNRPAENVEDKLKRLIVKDLIHAIGINEKYLFASALFDGNIEEFMASVNVLNNISDFESAGSYLSELAKKHQRDKENDITISFLELVEKKFDQP